MASWRDRLGKASFRGKEFYVETGELAGGRRGPVHEYPQRDVGYKEDLGRKTREFTIEGHVLGEDYQTAKDALLSALEENGPGELKHPLYGTRRVAADSFRVRESNAEGGIATFSITFLETEESPRFPTSAPSASESVHATGDSVLSALQARAEADEESGLALAAANLESVAAVIDEASAAIGEALAPALSVAEELATLRAQVAGLRSSASSLAAAPAAMLSSFVAMLESLPTMDEREGIDALLAAYEFVPAIARPAGTTPARVREQERYDLVDGIARTAMVVHAAKLAAEAVYDSYQDAVDVRDAVADAIDEQAEVADDVTFAALAQLRADLVRSVPGDASDLPSLVEYTPAASIPSLVLAHRLYGNLDREQDIVVRNAVKRPGFIPGGSALEVLSDA